MSLAERTRERADDHPFLIEGLRTGVINYTAAARFLDVEGDLEAVATALRRYAEDLDSIDRRERTTRVTMRRGVGTDESTDGDEPLLAIDGASIVADAGSDTAILATGDVGPVALAHVLDRLTIASIAPLAAGAGRETLVVVVAGRKGPDALRIVEDALASVPDR